MSEITIQVPAEQLEAIRTGLTGSRAVLWGAVYDSLCTAAERFAEDCNEYWRGAVEPDAIRAATAGLSAHIELLVALGPPPGD